MILVGESLMICQIHQTFFLPNFTAIWYVVQLTNHYDPFLVYLAEIYYVFIILLIIWYKLHFQALPT